MLLAFVRRAIICLDICSSCFCRYYFELIDWFDFGCLVGCCSGCGGLAFGFSFRLVIDFRWCFVSLSCVCGVSGSVFGFRDAVGV